MAPLTGAMATAMADERQRFAAGLAFVVTASGMAAFGIGAPFWGLVAGLAALGLDRVRRLSAGGNSATSAPR
jgi:benzoate membrane transport protein